MSKQEYWAAHVKAQSASGLSQQAYCRREGLQVKTFGYWSNKLRRQKRDEGFVVLTGDAAIEVVIGKATIRALRGFDAGEFRRVVEALSC